ncbi:MAG TPA: acetate--CoA ligase family protein [Stellaceae bacterium]|nr:acetate--CoA ligase family protein [Stellaceae bacterium]
MAGLANFLAPRSIAVIGASEGVEKIGGRLMHNLLRHGYAGRLYPINPNRGAVYGVPAYPTLAAAPRPIDLALVAIPAASVVQAIGECAAAGIASVVVASSGFADAGEAGAALQAQMIAAARRAGIRIAGPNTQGFYNVPAGICATFSPGVAIDPGPKGQRNRIGVVAQSGGLGFSLYNRGRLDGLDFSAVVGVGNQGDLELCDYADLLLDDTDTKVVMLFIEALKAPGKFIALAAKAAEREKPIVVAKVGRHAAARRAVASHTGSLSGSDQAYDAVFQRHGIIRAESPEEMLEIAALFTRHRVPRGNRVAIISATGGTAAWLTDTCEAHGLELPPIDAARQRRLKEFIPPYGSALNPVDITAQGLSGYAPSLAVLEDSPDLDAFILPISLAQDLRIAREGEAIAAIRARSEKPILIYTYTAPAESSKTLLAGWDLPCYGRMAGCARALQAGLAYRRFQERRKAAAPASRPDGLPPPEMAARFLAARGRIVCEYEAAELLAAYGIAALPGRLAATVDDAVAAAEAIGWPVALKLQSPQIPHKTEAKAVALAVADAASLRRAYAAIVANARAYAPAAELRGVLVQAMARRGIELIAGVANDADFGPIVMCGLGGIHAALFADTSFAPAPVSTVEAEAMLSRLKAAPLFAGLRGAPAADRRAMADVLVRLSHLAADARERIAEIDLNPVILYPEGQGAAPVDALIVQKEAL